MLGSHSRVHYGEDAFEVSKQMVDNDLRNHLNQMRGGLDVRLGQQVELAHEGDNPRANQQVPMPSGHPAQGLQA